MESPLYVKHPMDAHSLYFQVELWGSLLAAHVSLLHARRLEGSNRGITCVQWLPLIMEAEKGNFALFRTLQSYLPNRAELPSAPWGATLHTVRSQHSALGAICSALGATRSAPHHEEQTSAPCGASVPHLELLVQNCTELSSAPCGANFCIVLSQCYALGTLRGDHTRQLTVCCVETQSYLHIIIFILWWTLNRIWCHFDSHTVIVLIWTWTVCFVVTYL